MMQRNFLEENCEGIDASVFSSDMMFHTEQREMLRMYMGRWTRAIAEHEANEPPVPDNAEMTATSAVDRPGIGLNPGEE